VIHPTAARTQGTRFYPPLPMFVLLTGALAAAIAPVLIAHRHALVDPTQLPRPPIHLQLGKLRPPLPYRIVSFHRGRASKQLIRLAAQLGFNGVQFQIEGSTLDGVTDFAQRDQQEHLVDFCHSLGMTVTLWVHELSDLPPPWLPESLGPPSADNTALWQLLQNRYDTMLRDVVPQIDGLCLTVVETQVRATDPAVLLRLCNLLRGECDKYNKSFMVRTFVWYPREFARVMAAVNQLPGDTVIMSKCVPQDWQLRGMDAAEIGNVGGRPQIEEFDVAGEYFLRNAVANCMCALLQRQFNYGLSHNISGICVRVDRDDDDVLEQPNEVNLWTLAMLAGGVTDNLNDVWRAWAFNRYPAAAAPGVIDALRPTGDVVAEMLSIGPFAFADTRRFPPPLADEDLFGQNQQNWWWDPRYEPAHQAAETGDPAFTAAVESAKATALQRARLCLSRLNQVRDQLSPADDAILYTRLITNQVQLCIRAPMALAELHYRRMITTADPAERERMNLAMLDDLDAVREAAGAVYPVPQRIIWMGKEWEVGAPQGVPREAIFRWAYDMDLLRRNIDPRPPQPRRFDPTPLQQQEN
jgi:hypothetical protein